MWTESKLKIVLEKVEFFSKCQLLGSDPYSLWSPLMEFLNGGVVLSLVIQNFASFLQSTFSKRS